MKCKYCTRIIKNAKKNSVTCGKEKCMEKNKKVYQQGEYAKEYRKGYQKIQMQALWELSRRHIVEFRNIRRKLRNDNFKRT